MAQRQSLGLLVGVFLLACVSAAGAQSASFAAAPLSRIAGDWTSSAPSALPGSRPQLSFPGLSISGIDEGAAPANENLSRMVLLLAPSAAQQQALAAEITSLRNPSSPNYHEWLTPAAFASAYANSESDVDAVAAWLRSQGLQVAPLPAGRGWIEFSGTVAQAEQAFHTQIDLVSMANGSARPVVMSNISVPSALEPLIAGLVSLDGFVSQPAMTAPQPLSVSSSELAAETSPAAAEAFTPQLEAQLVDLQPLAKSGITGGGQTIAIAARSNVNAADVAAFRSVFGLPASPLSVVVNGADPGLTDGQAEATLAASWAGAAAPGAQILLVPAATTNATDGVDLSLAAIIDRDLASTVAVGYSACEAGMGTAHQAFYSAVYRQAAAEGIAVIAAAGDSGAAACAVAGGAPVTTGYGVNALASTQWNTAVGVAGFGATGRGASSAAWSAWSPIDPADLAYAGGGGGSTVNALPAWQPLPANLPAGMSTSYRLLPDVSLPTAIDSSVNPGLAFCLSADSTSTGCTLVRSGGSGAAAAYFAGIAALMAQQHGAEGNVAPLLYQLGNNAGIYQSGIYNDVQQGSTQLKCAAGSTGCGADGQIGFAAGAGFDLATGLGVPDANALVRAKPQATGTSPVTVDNNIATGQTINPSGTLVLSATIDAGSGGTVPTGTVEFYDETTSVNLGVDTLTAATGTTSTVQQSITGQLAQGTHSIIAEYSGDSTYAAANSAAVSVSVQLGSTTTTVTPPTASPAAGSNFTATALVTSASAGVGAPAPTGTVQFDIDGVSAGSGVLVAGTSAGASTHANATATLIAPATVGAHTISAIYPGDNTYAGSTSPTVPITLGKGATTTTVAASPATLTPNTPEALTATVLPANAAAGPTVAISGTVSFYDGTTLLGQATISSNSATLSGVPLTDNVAHSITAVYSGDNNWLTSTSAVLPLAATTLPVTVVLTSSAGSTSGGAVYLTATVTPNSLPPAVGEQNPTGTVVFYQGTTVLGTATLTPAAAGDAATTTFTAPALPGGQDQLTAYYEGDAYFDPGTSAAITLTVQAFTITPAASNPATNLTVVQGASGSESFVITGQGGFNNQVQVICTAPAGDNMTCTPTPQQVTPPGTVTFVVQTSTTPLASNAPAGRGPVWPRAAGGAALAGLVFFLLPFGRRAQMLLGARSRRALMLLLLLVGLGGAGMGCTSSDALATFGTPLGIATFKVTATAYVDNTVVSQNVYFTVNVVSQ